MLNWLSLAAKDVRFAARLLIRSPAVSAIAVTALAIGIGLTTAMFSVVNGTILRGLPFDEPDELLNILSYKPQDGATELVSVHDYADWRERQSSFEGLAVWGKAPAFLRTPEGKAERHEVGYISSNLFDLLRVDPYLGRSFERDDELPGSEPVVILSHGLWQNRFDADPSIVGRRLFVDGATRTVVGVMPPGFAFPIREALWIPVNTIQLGSKRDGLGRYYFVLGRLADGVSESEAQAELSSIARGLALEYPETNRDLDVMVGPYINEVIGEKIVNLTYMMLAAVFGVLLVACANVAILQLTRAILRTKEIAARLALGAGRTRVMIQSLAEAAVLSTAGALGGLAIAQYRIERFNEALQSAPMVPFWLDVKLDGTSLMAVLGLTILSSLISGALPAMKASRTDLAEVLKSESGGSIGPRLRGFGRGLVIVELALSCGILVGAGLMIKTVVELDKMNFAFATRDVLTVRVMLERTEYPDPESLNGFCSEIVTRLRGKPGVEAVALTSYLPGMGSGLASFRIEGKTEAQEHGIETRFSAVSPEFFDTFAVRLLDGRSFLPNDDRDAPRVAIVNESWVERYMPDESPLGKRIRLFAPGLSGRVESWTIVGVAPDLAMNRRRPGTGFVEEDSAGLYVPMAQNPTGSIGIAIRTGRPPMSLTDVVRAEIETIAPGAPVFDFNSLDRAIADQNVYYWVISDGFSMLGVAALFLASIGLYGIMSSSVNRRRQEIGVRVAMGAQPRNVLGMILKQGLIQLALGILLGLCLAVTFAGMLEVTLFQVQPWDPFVFASIVLALLVTGTAACIIPARRATRVDPVAVLRQE